MSREPVVSRETSDGQRTTRNWPLVLGVVALGLVGYNVVAGTMSPQAVFVGAIGLVLLAVGLLRR